MWKEKQRATARLLLLGLRRGFLLLNPQKFNEPS